jgi:hypothetical protein
MMKSSKLHLLLSASTAVLAFVALFSGKGDTVFSLCFPLFSGQNMILYKLNRWEELFVEIVTEFQKGMSGHDRN